MNFLHTPSTIIAVLHGMIALQCIPIAGKHCPPGRSAIITLQNVFQPVLNTGEKLADKNILQELLRQLQRVGAAELQHLFRVRIHFKRHVERTIDACDGVIRVGTGLADDKIIAVGRGGLIHGVALSLRIFRGRQKRCLPVITFFYKAIC